MLSNIGTMATVMVIPFCIILGQSLTTLIGKKFESYWLDSGNNEITDSLLYQY